MNCEQFTLEELEVEPYQLREVLRCLLHTILFNRALGPVRPKEEYVELFDATYVRCDDRLYEKSVEEKIEQFMRTFDQKNLTRQLCLSFYEKRDKKIWFTKQEEKLLWEQWLVTITVTLQAPASEGERTQRLVQLEQKMHAALARILKLVNENRNHIPPFVSSSKASFAFEISIKQGSEGWSLFRLFQSATPSLLS